MSVVIPTYRGRGWFEGAVISALVQDYVNLEVVIVGDGCPDLDLDVFRGDPRVRIVNLPVHHGDGGAAPRNFGIMLGAGELVAYLDEEHAWRRDHVSSLYEAMRAADAALGFSPVLDGHDLAVDPLKRASVHPSCLLHLKSRAGRSGWWRSAEGATSARGGDLVSRMVDDGAKWIATRRATLVDNAAARARLG